MYPEKRVVPQIPRWDQFIRRMRGHAVAREQGINWSVNIMLATSQSSRMVPEWGAFPKGKRVRNAWGKFTFDKLVRTMELSGEAMVYGGTPKTVMSNEVEGLELGLSNDIERNAFLTKRGEHAEVVDCTDANTIEVDRWQYLEEGMLIDIRVMTTGLVGDGVLEAEILTIAITETTGHAVITINKDLGAFAAVGVTYGVYLSDEYGLKNWGLGDICIDTDPTCGELYGGIDRTDEARWRAHYWSLGAPVTGRHIAAMKTRIKLRAGAAPNVAWAHPYVADELIEEGRAYTTVDMRVMKYELWGDVVFVGNMPILPNAMCPFEKMFFVSEQYLQLAHPQGWPMFGAWRRTGHKQGSILHAMEETWGYRAAWIMPWQIVCKRCNAQGMIDNITWTATGS
jgi:hypothetical protein